MQKKLELNQELTSLNDELNSDEFKNISDMEDKLRIIKHIDNFKNLLNIDYTKVVQDGMSDMYGILSQLLTKEKFGSLTDALKSEATKLKDEEKVAEDKLKDIIANLDLKKKEFDKISKLIKDLSSSKHTSTIMNLFKYGTETKDISEEVNSALDSILRMDNQATRKNIENFVKIYTEMYVVGRVANLLHENGIENFGEVIDYVNSLDNKDKNKNIIGEIMKDLGISIPNERVMVVEKVKNKIEINPEEKLDAYWINHASRYWNDFKKDNKVENKEIDKMLEDLSKSKKATVEDGYKVWRKINEQWLERQAFLTSEEKDEITAIVKNENAKLADLELAWRKELTYFASHNKPMLGISDDYVKEMNDKLYAESRTFWSNRYDELVDLARQFEEEQRKKKAVPPPIAPYSVIPQNETVGEESTLPLEPPQG